jgi:hypothetical protein
MCDYIYIIYIVWCGVGVGVGGWNCIVRRIGGVGGVADVVVVGNVRPLHGLGEHLIVLAQRFDPPLLLCSE